MNQRVPVITEMAMQLLTPGGFILADNTLWDGLVVDHQYDNDHLTQGIELFNDHVAVDSREESHPAYA